MNPVSLHFIFGFAGAAVALVTATNAAAAETLTKQQMDRVSAGTVAVTSQAVAGAVGSSGYASTHTFTHSVSAPNDAFELGLGHASANACCSPNTGAAVWTDSYADGLNQSQHSVNFDLATKLSATNAFDTSSSLAFGTEVVVSNNRTGSILSGAQAPSPPNPDTPPF
ncbi:MAG: hypothetical protein J5I81_03450 [Nitrococcus mobilis]|nr:hypothetical protein [Nitrococcus mobilis]